MTRFKLHRAAKASLGPRFFTALTMLALFAALTVGLAGPLRAADREKVAAFLQVTGFDVALDSIALSAVSAPQMLGLERDEFGTQWTRLAESVFDTEVMRTRATDILEQTLEDGLLVHAADFYASDLGQRLVEAENASHFGDDDQKQAEGAALVTQLQDTEDPRIGLYERMSIAIDPSNIGAQAMTEIQVRFILAAAYAGLVELRTDEAGLRAALTENAEEMQREMAESSLRNAAYTYREFSLEEVTTYTEALEDPDMMMVYELMNAVHFEVMSNRFEALASRMGQIQPEQEL